MGRSLDGAVKLYRVKMTSQKHAPKQKLHDSPGCQLSSQNNGFLPACVFDELHPKAYIILEPPHRSFEDVELRFDKAVVRFRGAFRSKICCRRQA